jgi:hypothetical protein
MRDKFAKCLRWFAGAVGVTAVGYAADVSVAWIRYECVPRPVRGDGADTLLDRLCLCAKWRERH